MANPIAAIGTRKMNVLALVGPNRTDARKNIDVPKDIANVANRIRLIQNTQSN